MKIHFLGTSHGVPMSNRHYQSILIETIEGIYLVDAGAPVMDCLINNGYNLTRLKAVFVTHVHQDHMLGLVDVVNLASWYYKDMSFEVYMPEQRGVDAVEGFCEVLLQHKTSEKISYNIVKEGTIFDNGNLRITAVSTDHMDATTDIAYGYLIEAEGKRIYITGDMHRTLKDFPNELLAQPTDLVISECAHFPAEDLIKKLDGVNAGKVMIVHVFPIDKYDVLREYGKRSAVELIFPNDGDEYLL